MSDDSIICYCFGVKRDVVEAYLKMPNLQIDQLIEETKITTRCAACSVDLDTLIDKVNASENLTRLRERKLAEASRGWKAFVDRLDSGFFICDTEIQSSLRLANYPTFKCIDSWCAPHSYRLTLYDNDGNVRVRAKGSIGANEELSIPFAEFDGCPEQGWFGLHMLPKGPGRYGTLRPQLALKGRNWVSCYHTQYHTDATRSFMRCGVPLLSVSGRTRALISLINGSARPTEYEATLEGESTVARGRLAANGACLFNVDEAFPGRSGDGAVVLRFESDEPLRKNVINRHPDGSLGVDHFPNIV